MCCDDALPLAFRLVGEDRLERDSMHRRGIVALFSLTVLRLAISHRCTGQVRAAYHGVELNPRVLEELRLVHLRYYQTVTYCSRSGS